MKKISDQKLNASFENFNALDIHYVQLAKEVAQDYLEGRPLDYDKITKIRLLSCCDKAHLKGDFVISMIISISEEIESEMEFNPWRGGKRLKIEEHLINKIFNNDFTKSMSVTAFCALHGITRTKYYRIINCNVKLSSDKKYLEKLKKKVYRNIQKKDNFSET